MWASIWKPKHVQTWFPNESKIDHKVVSTSILKVEDNDLVNGALRNSILVRNDSNHEKFGFI